MHWMPQRKLPALLRPTHRSLGIRLLLLTLLTGAASFAQASLPTSPVALSDEELSDAEPTDLTNFYGDEETVLISTGTIKPVRLAPSVTSVITSRDIKAMGWRTLDQALESVPGIHITPSGINRMNSVISLRGIHTGENSQLMMLINGMPINDLQNGGRPPRFTLPVDNIARIEIIRGPGSAVFGADAFAGVINIITKEAHELRGVKSGMRIGTFNTQDVWAQYGGQHNGWDIAVSTEYTHTNGDRNRVVQSDFQSWLDGLNNTHASLAPGPLQTQYGLLNTSLTLHHGNWNLWLNSWNLNDAGVGAGAAQAIDPVGRQDADQYSAKLDYKNIDFGENTELAAQAYHRVLDQQVYFRILPPGATVPIGNDGNLFGTSTKCGSTPCMVAFPDGVWGNPGSRQQESKLEVSITHSGINRHRIRSAFGMVHSRFTPRETKNFGPGVLDGSLPPPASVDGALTDVTGTANVYSPNTDRTVSYLSLQDEWQFIRDWSLTAGVRHDDYSDFGRTTNPRLALVWNAGYNRTHKLLYGRAFRAPSFGELRFRNNPVTIGNPSLKPETIEMLELATDYRPTMDLHTQFGLFVYRSQDMIEYISGVAQNRGEQTGKGLEAEATWQPTYQFKLKGNAALQYTKSDITGEHVGDAPQRQAYLAAIWQVTPRVSASAQTKWVASRHRFATDTRTAPGDYALTNLTVRYIPQFASRWELAAMVYNLFDKRAKQPSAYNVDTGSAAIPGDYPIEGRAFFIEGRYNLDK